MLFFFKAALVSQFSTEICDEQDKLKEYKTTCVFDLHIL